MVGILSWQGQFDACMILCHGEKREHIDLQAWQGLGTRAIGPSHRAEPISHPHMSIFAAYAGAALRQSSRTIQNCYLTNGAIHTLRRLSQ